MQAQRTLLVAAFGADFALSLAGLSIALYLVKVLGHDTLACGEVAAFGSLSYSIACFAFGKLSHRRERLPVLAAFGAAWFAVFMLAMAFVPSLPGFFLWGVVVAGMAVYWPALQVWMGGSRSPAETSRRLRRFNIAWTLGMMSGYFASGALFDLRPSLGFLVAAVAMFSLVPLLLLAQAEPATEIAAPPAGGAAHGPDLLTLSWLCNFTCYFCIGIVRAIYADLGDHLGFSAFIIGLLTALLMAAQAVTFFAVRNPDWMYRRVVLFAGLVAGLGGMLLLCLFDHVLIHALGMILLGVMAAIGYKFSLYHSLVRPAGGKTHTGNHEGILSAGNLLGPALGGVAGYALASPYAPYQLAAVVLTGVILYFLWDARRRRRTA